MNLLIRYELRCGAGSEGGFTVALSGQKGAGDGRHGGPGKGGGDGFRG